MTDYEQARVAEMRPCAACCYTFC